MRCCVPSPLAIVCLGIVRATRMINLDDLLAAHEVIRHDIQQKLRCLDESERKARLVIDQCANERTRFDGEIAALMVVEKMYHQRFVPDDEGDHYAPPQVSRDAEIASPF